MRHPSFELSLGPHRMSVIVSDALRLSELSGPTSISLRGIHGPLHLTVKGAVHEVDAPGEVTLSGPIIGENSSIDVYLSGPTHSALHSRPKGDTATLVYETQGLRHYKLKYRGNVGIVEWDWKVDGRQITVGLELFPTKMSYREDFAAIVDDLRRMAPLLVASSSGVAGAEYGFQAGTQQTELEWLIAVSAELDGLEHGIPRLLNGLRKHIVSGVALAPADRLRGRRPISRRKAGNVGRVGAGNALVQIQTLQSSASTPINKFLRWELDRLNAHCTRVVGQPWFQNLSGEYREPIQRLAVSVRTWQDQMAGIAPEPAVVHLEVHLRDPHYGPVIRAIRRLREILSPLQGATLVGLKDLPTLYEYWVFVKIAHMLAPKIDSIEGFDRPLIRQIGADLVMVGGSKSEIRVKTVAGTFVNCQYNRQFNGLPTTNQRPDAVISISTNTGYLLIDAKYRLGADREYLRRHGSVGPLEDDINVIHRYRDAIVDIANTSDRLSFGGVIAFPSEIRERYRKHRFFRSWLAVGVGGMPMLPGNTDLMLEVVESYLDMNLEELT